MMINDESFPVEKQSGPTDWSGELSAGPGSHWSILPEILRKPDSDKLSFPPLVSSSFLQKQKFYNAQSTLFPHIIFERNTKKSKI